MSKEAPEGGPDGGPTDRPGVMARPVGVEETELTRQPFKLSSSVRAVVACSSVRPMNSASSAIDASFSR